MLTARARGVSPLHALALSSIVIAIGLWQSSCGGSGGGSGGGGANVVPNANFTAAPTQGPRPLDVQFANTTTGPVTDWLWEFGDGTTSTLEDPLHQYADAGSYTVKLTATGPGGVDDLTRQDYVQVFAPLADVSFESQTAGSAPAAPWFAFYGAGGSVGHVLLSAAGGGDNGMPSNGQLWCELGAESTDTTLPPGSGAGATPITGAGISQEFTYPVGQSVLQLDALFVNAEGHAQSAHNDWMSVDVSDGATTFSVYRRDTFSATASTSTLHAGHITTPLESVTADLAQLFPASKPTTLFTLSVQVGNGGDGTDPSHGYVDHVRFAAPGAPLTVQFNATPQIVEVGLPVSFADHTQGAPTAWSWDFGDGLASTSQNVMHAYAQPGVYDVRLRVSAPGAAAELLRDDLVSVFAPNGNVDFDAAPRSAAVNETVTFTNLSSGAFVSWTWDFGDGQTFLQTNQATPVLHAYTSAALYSVRLTGKFQNNTTVFNFKPDFIDVLAVPAITTQPQDKTVNVGQTATFTVVATGTALHYEWSKKTPPSTTFLVIPSAPDLPSYITPATTGGDDGEQFRVRVFNAVDEVTSNAATLTVISPPVITQQPQDQTVCAGATAMFSVNATGHGLSYQWRKDGNNIGGATGSSYITPPTAILDDGALFSVVVSNAAANVPSADATLTVHSIPVITQQPQNKTVCAGTTALFSITATGVGLTYQWHRNGNIISGATSRSYLTPPTTIGDDGDVFSVSVANTCGSVPSSNATLTVTPIPVITQQPVDAYVIVGATAQFSVTATGPSLTYQWLKNGSIIAGATSSAYTTPVTVIGDSGAQYSVVVTSACAAVPSNSAVLHVAPTWTSIFAGSLSGCAGCHNGTPSSATFSMMNATTAYANMFGIATTQGNSCAGTQRIHAFNPADSSLYNTVLPTYPTSCIMFQMGALTAQKRQQIFDYIKAGAP